MVQIRCNLINLTQRLWLVFLPKKFLATNILYHCLEFIEGFLFNYKLSLLLPINKTILKAYNLVLLILFLGLKKKYPQPRRNKSKALNANKAFFSIHRWLPWDSKWMQRKCHILEVYLKNRSKTMFI